MFQRHSKTTLVVVLVHAETLDCVVSRSLGPESSKVDSRSKFKTEIENPGDPGLFTGRGHTGNGVERALLPLVRVGSR